MSSIRALNRRDQRLRRYLDAIGAPSSIHQPATGITDLGAYWANKARLVAARAHQRWQRRAAA